MLTLYLGYLYSRQVQGRRRSVASSSILQLAEKGYIFSVDNLAQLET